MKLLALLLFLNILVWPTLGFSQENDQEDELLTSEVVAQERFIRNESIQRSNTEELRNIANTSQTGNRNELNVDQFHTGTLDPNLVNIMQVGNSNSVDLSQEGSDIISDVSQTGNRNHYEGNLSGNNINSEVNQIGNSNEIRQHVSGNDLEYSLMQNGNNNEIIQIENGKNGQQYEVTQQGSGMTITIINGGINLP